MTGQSGTNFEVIGYGEDSLTLWAIRHKLQDILAALSDRAAPEGCKVFYRPGFGRRGGNDSAQFGEFDFIILSPTALYLGESKWNRSSELRQGELTLRREQKTRHALFRKYLADWYKFRSPMDPGTPVTWSEFVKRIPPKYELRGITKRVAPPGSQTSRSLLRILEEIWTFYGGRRWRTTNVVLYLHESDSGPLPRNKTGFKFVRINYDGTKDGYIEL